MNVVTIVLAILGVGLAVLMFNNSAGQSFGMDNDRFASLLYLLPITAMVAVAVLRSRRSINQTLQQFMVWVVIVLALVTGYLYRDELRPVADRVLAGLMPGRPVIATAVDGGSEVIVHKGLSGHFQIETTVDKTFIDMMVDTGASSVVLTYDDAKRVGLPVDTLSFTMLVATANGEAHAAPVRLDSISVGPITRTNVPAIVTEPGKLDKSLLGMSFLSTLSSMQMQPDELRLRD
jgi:aspartyl protease family protein